MNRSFLFFARLVLLAALGVSTTDSDAADSAAVLKAQAFDLAHVRLLDSPFKQAMERNADYLLRLEADRFLHNTRKYAGLQPKGELYGGWEAKGIAGHTLGHYLTALAQQFAATGDARFRERLSYTVSEMATCQDAYGDGYVGALPPLELETLRGFKEGKLQLQGRFNFKGGAWVPWYTQHKILAGLIDAWVLAGNLQAKAVALKLADWTDVITAGLTPEQQQTMLQVEHGGMLDSLAELSARTGDPRYLTLSKRFYHRAVLDPLLAGRDELPGKHANTQIPKVIGTARTYEIVGDASGRSIAENFWNLVVHKYSFANGGNSDNEHFFLAAKAGQHLAHATAETCNTYNMLKLTKHLFAWEPKAEYADFYERALYNHILASQEPRQGMFTYFVSLKPGHFKTYSTPFDSFWCCVGSGIENHSKYGEAIYFRGANELYVNLFIPSVVTWREKGFSLEQRTDYPEGNVSTFSIDSAPSAALSLRVRCPGWATEPLRFELNGEAFPVASQPGGYAEISRVWKAGDSLRVTFPMSVRTEALYGSPDKVAFLYGPLLLAGDLGAVAETKSFPYAKDQAENFRAPTAKVPALVVNARESLVTSLARVPGDGVAFRTTGLGRPTDVTLRPLKDLFYDHYNVYWDVLSPDEWTKREQALSAAAEQRRREEARIVDEVRFGEQQSEIDHALTADRSATGDNQDRKWRDAREGGYFAVTLKVVADAPQILRCTYRGGETGARTFHILIDGEHLATQTLNRDKPGEFFHVDYPLPPLLVRGKEKIVVRFQSQEKQIAGGVIQAATMKAAE